MKSIKKIKISIMLSIIFFFVAFFSLSMLVFIPKVEETYQMVIGYSVAIVFWSSLSFGCTFCIRTNLAVKRLLMGCSKEEISKKSKIPGVMSFSGNIYHLILYLVIVIGVILIISDLVNSWISSNIMFPVISITMFSFAMHCIVDGSNYKIYKQMKEGRNNV